MKKLIPILICVLFLIVSLNLTSAKLIDYKEHIIITKYNSEDKIAMTKTIYANYDNDDRYSTHDYRHGYSYRTSQNYWDKQHKDIIYLSDKGYDDNWYGYNGYDHDKYSPSKYDYSYKRKKSGCNQDWEWKEYDRRLGDYYDSSSRKIRTKKCYSSPPKGKLFYIRC